MIDRADLPFTVGLAARMASARDCPSVSIRSNSN
jgi:hypothetical protein